eukprot:CAMPEP_0182530478 /NCGR_PEP_ID=MMETSP1323-20130603/5943_1 /TAXON_ID=236787 /ORGANISM="Florenciella parvula, Strain RCC1693" /LENGTH=131 /DNA_ID=CAMNT_0024739777 /DNA_START=36 /DNA_END=431 /DNA_ORIENTATION=+
MAMVPTSGAEMLGKRRWAVVGDALNQAKPAYRVAEKLREAGKDVVVVNPRAREDVVSSGLCVLSLRDCAQPPIDVVDLIISPKIGPDIIVQMAELGIPDVFIQPGAGTDEIREAAASAGISVHEGCVLIEL